MAFQKTLVSFGLSDPEAAVWSALLEVGTAPVAAIVKKSGLKRAHTYFVLNSLIEKGLAEQVEKEKKAHFRLSSPVALQEFLERQRTTLEENKKTLDTILPSLLSAYRLSSGRPAIQFFEGKEGMRRVLEDSLTSKTIIYSYLDAEVVAKCIEDVNRAYVAKREKLGLKKRGIVFDTPFARTYLAGYHKAVTETKFVATRNTVPIECIMQIYDGKVSYLTLSDNQMIGVIVEDSRIFQLHKNLFECLWQKAE